MGEPGESPAASASVNIEVTLLPDPHSPRVVVSSNPMTPILVLTPATNAVAVPAESGTWKSVL